MRIRPFSLNEKWEKTHIVQTRALFYLLSLIGYITTCMWSLVFLHKKPFFPNRCNCYLCSLVGGCCFWSWNRDWVLIFCTLHVIPLCLFLTPAYIWKKMFVLLQRENMDHLWFDKQETRLCRFLCFVRAWWTLQKLILPGQTPLTPLDH